MAILVTECDGIGFVTLDRPQRAHAYNHSHLQDLLAGFERLAAKLSVIVVQSTGNRAFCGGADLDEMKAVAPLSALDLFSQNVFTAIARSPAISIAAVQGAAVAGGFELALACDLRVVGPHAQFWLPETALGLIPSAGGCTRLTRILGPGRSKQVILVGQKIDAQQAVDWGLALSVSPDPRTTASELAQTLVARDARALQLAKQVIDIEESNDSLAAERRAEALLYAKKQGK